MCIRDRAGEHYTPGFGSLTIPAGTRTKWIAIPVFGGVPAAGAMNFRVLIPTAIGARIPAGGLSATGTIVPAAITAFFPLPGVQDLYVIRFPTGLGQAYVVEESQSLDSQDWTPLTGLINGSGATIAHTQYSDTPSAFFRVRVVAAPPSN